jgi:hypothetical protein
MKLRAAFAKSLAKQQQPQQAVCYFHRNFRTAFLFCRSIVLVSCLRWRTDRGTGRWADDFWAFQLAHEKKNTHTHTHKHEKSTTKRKRKLGSWQGFFFYLSLFWYSHTGNQCFFFFILHFFNIENLAKSHQKNSKT